MRRTLLLCLCLFLGACRDDSAGVLDAAALDAGPADAASVDADPARGAEVWVATWNLNNFPADGTRVALVSGILNQIHPDVVSVEEIASETGFTDLVAAMPGYGGVLNDDPFAAQRVGLIWDESRVTVDHVQTLFVGQTSSFPRPPLRARVTVVAASATIDLEVIVVHLKAQIDADSEARRRATCVALKAYIDGERAAGGEDFVVLGDWNDDLTDPPASNVFTAFLDAPADYSFLTLAAEEAGGISYLPYARFIDHILVTSDTGPEVGGAQAEPLRLDQADPDFADTVSDHVPVLARLKPTPL